ncbi:unnamed protein product, partial [Prorocentrum cordatum]
SANSLIKIQGNRAPSISLELLSSRVQLKSQLPPALASAVAGIVGGTELENELERIIEADRVASGENDASAAEAAVLAAAAKTADSAGGYAMSSDADLKADFAPSLTPAEVDDELMLNSIIGNCAVGAGESGAVAGGGLEELVDSPYAKWREHYESSVAAVVYARDDQLAILGEGRHMSLVVKADGIEPVSVDWTSVDTMRGRVVEQDLHRRPKYHHGKEESFDDAHIILRSVGIRLAKVAGPGPTKIMTS